MSLARCAVRLCGGVSHGNLTGWGVCCSWGGNNGAVFQVVVGQRQQYVALCYVTKRVT